MKTAAAMILSLGALLMMTGCQEEAKKAEETKTYQYTTAEVYTQMCAKCHGQNGQGVADIDEKTGKPKGPALNKQELWELKLAITDIKSGGLNQSSGTEHEVMEHNYKAIKKKGMDYDTDAMATYIVEHFKK